MDVMIYPCMDLSQPLLIKGDPHESRLLYEHIFPIKQALFTKSLNISKPQEVVLKLFVKQKVFSCHDVVMIL